MTKQISVREIIIALMENLNRNLSTIFALKFLLVSMIRTKVCLYIKKLVAVHNCRNISATTIIFAIVNERCNH
jgi:hypothetical protein